MNDKQRGKYGPKHYGSKHSEETAVDPEVAAEIDSKQKDGRLPCAVACKIAIDCDVTLAEVGRNADLMEARIDQCILGLFGFKKKEGKKRKVTPALSVSRDVEKAIRCRMPDGYLTCKTIWEIAASLGESRYSISQAAEALKIKISKCQLGAF